jgi:hypothetical protein
VKQLLITENFLKPGPSNFLEDVTNVDTMTDRFHNLAELTRMEHL